MSATDYLISRIRADVDYLSSQSLLEAQDRDAIHQRLDRAAAAASNRARATADAVGHTVPSGQSVVDALAVQFGSSGIGHSPASHESPSAPPPPVRPGERKQTARALWAYQGSQPDDLAFNKGDVVIVHTKENDNWWRGSVMHDPSGRQGLFPSNHVEIFGGDYEPSHSAPTYQAPFPYSPSQANSGYYGSTDPEKAALQPYHPPPPPTHQHYYLPPPPPQPYYAQQQQVMPPAPSPAAPEKKSKFKLPGSGSGMGNTLAHSFVGGAGFGAGSSVASHVVNAIF